MFPSEFKDIKWFYYAVVDKNPILELFLFVDANETLPPQLSDPAIYFHVSPDIMDSSPLEPKLQ